MNSYLTTACNTDSKIVFFWTTSLNNHFFKLCDNDLTKNELLISLKGMQNNKIPGNDGLTEEFYETFWDEIKYFF